jgi:hypothetical protein
MNGETSLTTFAQNLIENKGPYPAVHPVEYELQSLLNSSIKDVVYNTLTLLDRRMHGIFFSGPKWANTLCSKINISHWNRFVDPSVGTGDLLLEICANLPLEPSFFETVTMWSKRLVAVDLRASFLKITWIRIHMLALYRHREIDPTTNGSLLPLPDTFITGDSLQVQLQLNPGDCVIMNPPYQRIDARPRSFVGKGKRSAAALHVEQVLLQSAPGTGIVALLPDVLRSGSSYKKFRDEVRQRLIVQSFEPAGNFGTDADVDVAILVATVRQKASGDEESRVEDSITLGDKFNVCVGPVVPHRTPGTGPEHPYLTAKNAEIGGEIVAAAETAAFAARLERGPFVIVRRTSSPSDRKRARATLVSAEVDFYVENHLLVISPKNHSVSDCKELMNVLEDARTDQWLNEHIRCRHLTVGALKLLPWLADI